jgi:hypothetical protein
VPVFANGEPLAGRPAGEYTIYLTGTGGLEVHLTDRRQSLNMTECEELCQMGRTEFIRSKGMAMSRCLIRHPGSLFSDWPKGA